METSFDLFLLSSLALFFFFAPRDCCHCSAAPFPNSYTIMLLQVKKECESGSEKKKKRVEKHLCLSTRSLHFFFSSSSSLSFFTISRQNLASAECASP